MNELQIFNYESKEVRTILIHGETWWIAGDICNILELSDVSKTVSRLDFDEKGQSQIPTLGGKQTVLIINESGLYNLIIRSDKPESKKFKKWITSEVLPSIRKTGQYGVKAPSNLIEALKLALEQAEQIEEMKPKALEYDLFISGKDFHEVGTVAKSFNIGRNKFFEMLRKEKILMDNNLPYEEYKKYFKVVYKPVSINGVIDNKPVTLFNPSGISYVAKKFNLVGIK